MAINEAAIRSFHNVTRAAVEDGEHEKVVEYRKLIAAYEEEIAILRKFV